MSVHMSPTALALARGQQAGQCVGEKIMPVDGTIVPAPAEPSQESAELERLRRELDELRAQAQVPKPEPEQPKSGILATVGNIAMVRGEYNGKPTLGLYPLDDKGEPKRAKDGEWYALKGYLHVISWWQEHAEAIRTLLDAAKQA